MDIQKKQTKNIPLHETLLNKETHQPRRLDEFLEQNGKKYERLYDSPKNNTRKRKCFLKFILWSLIIFFSVSAVTAGLFLWQASNTLSNITDENETTRHSFVKTITTLTKSESYKSLKGFSDGRINILLLGRANTHKSGKNLTDTIMLVGIDTTSYKVSLLSLPRDLLIKNKDFYTKINALYQIGLKNNVGADYIIKTVEDVTGQNVHYYFVLDFEGFIKIIDTLGGINIDVPRHIKDTRYPGPGYSYETFEVWPGLQKMDGETALKYARTRHDDIEGDFGRAKRQQQVMLATRNRAFSLGTILNPFKINEILTTLGEHLHTNIKPDEISAFIALIKKVDTQHITNIVVDAWKPGSLLISAHYYNSGGGMSGLVPRIGNYTQIQELAKNIFSLDKIKERKKEIKNENPTITLVNTTKDSSLTNKIKQTLQSLGFDNIKIAGSQPFSTQPVTTVIDTTQLSKPFSLDELIKKLPAQKISKENLNTYDTDFIIFVGNDMLEVYKYEAITQQELENDNNKQ